MSKLEQKHIEGYFKEYGVQDDKIKAKLLPEVTSIIHERNKLVIEHEQEDEEYKKEQIEEDIKHLEDSIEETFQEHLNQE